MLAQLTATELHHLLPEDDLERATRYSISNRTELEAELSRIRDRGFATSREESEEGVASVAVVIPFQGPGIRMSLSAAAPLHRLSTSQYPLVAAIVREAAEDLAHQLSGSVVQDHPIGP